ncbi:Chaperone protein like [Actinidia chinensis var. chinensis]|uniref:Chaperone protein like n=1 Tax=Actinidia chinensis var. chinensis TaxID=1590841 RepID=A0A2R6RAJ9_ACTCC|nr:Chaperone protein like [Actinidia chinensis var. chinensis]
MSVTRAASVLPAVRCEATGSSNGAPPPRNPRPFNPFFYVPKPSWIVRTESNVRIEQKKKPEPPCVECSGMGRVDCRYCCGRGRTNHVNEEMLPKGEWPKWCMACRGSGLNYCSRCLGTGEYKQFRGFRLHNRGPNSPRSPSAADLLLNGEQPSSNQ